MSRIGIRPILVQMYSDARVGHPRNADISTFLDVLKLD